MRTKETQNVMNTVVVDKNIVCTPITNTYFNTLLEVDNVSGYYHADDKNIYVKLEDVLREIGFVYDEEKVSAKSGGKTDYNLIRWNRAIRYINEINQSVIETGAYTIFADYNATIWYDKQNIPDFIPSQIAYLLAMRANNKKAKKFQMKLAFEILPSIEKHGIYCVDSLIDVLIIDEKRRDEIIQELWVENQQMKQNKLSMEQTMAQQQAYIMELEEKSDYLDSMISPNGLLTSTAIAKDFGISGVTLNKLLHTLELIYFTNNGFEVYQAYSRFGLTKKANIQTSQGILILNRWTEAGREFITLLLKQHGILIGKDNTKVIKNLLE